MHRELTTSEALLCVAYLEGIAVRKLLSTPRVLDGLVREYMVEWNQGTDTSRAEFTETVVRMLSGRWGCDRLGSTAR